MTDTLLDLDTGQRSDLIRFLVLDSDGREIGTVHPRFGAASIAYRGDAASTRILRGVELVGSEATDFSPSDQLAPVWITEAGDEHPLGRYVSSEVSQVRSSDGLTDLAALDWADQSALLDVEVAQSLGFDAGTYPTTAELAIFEAAGFYNAVIAASAVGAFAEPAAWPSGSGSYLAALNELAGTCGQWPVAFDALGRPTLDAIPDPAEAIPSVDYDTAPSRLVAGSVVRTTDTTAPNRFRRIGGTDTAPFVGVYDLPSDAANSEAEIDRVITNTDKITATTGADATRAARAAAVAAHRDAEQVAFSTTPDPRRSGHEVVRVDGDLWIVHEWTLPLGPGLMTHRAGRVLGG